MQPDFAAARRAMLESQLRPQGVTDMTVLGAMGTVPREEFVPDKVRALAYLDRPLDLGDGRAMMPPAVLGRLLTELRPKSGEKALIVGRATDYAATVLQKMGLDVEAADGPDVPGNEAFDLILIDGAVEEVPQQLAARLAPGGRLGGAIVDRGVTRLAVGRSAGGAFGLKTFADAEVPVLPGFAQPPAFTF
jgi:protein-L-isoaspartate(D-aspartate) O-methyltransferase